MRLGIPDLPPEDEEPCRQSTPMSFPVIDQSFELLTTFSKKLEPAVELSSSLRAKEPRGTVLESKVAALEDLVRFSQAQAQAQTAFASRIHISAFPPSTAPPSPTR
jgi:hypothetical protein